MDKTLYQTTSLPDRRKMALVRAQEPRRHTSRLDLGLCVLIGIQYYVAEEGLELYLEVIDKGCLLSLSFLGGGSIDYCFLESDFFQPFVKTVIIPRYV